MATVNPRIVPVNLALRWRLMLAMGLLAAIVLALGVAAPAALGRLRAGVREAVQVDGLMSRLAADVALKAQTARHYDQSYFLHIESRGELYRYRVRWDRAAAELGKAIADFTAASTSADDRRQARIWAAAYALYIDGFRDVAIQVDRGELTSPQAADRQLDAYRENIETLVDLSAEFAARKREAAERSVEGLNAEAQRLTAGLGVLAALGVAAAVAWSLYFPARLTRPLGALSAAAGRLAAGDLAARAGLDGGDEIGALGRSFDQMAATIERRTADLEGLYRAAEAARCEAEAARAQVAEQLATIAAQRSAIEAMSVPLLPVAERVLVMPLVGGLDGARIARAQERALRAVEASRAAFLIIDITGVPVVDTQVAQGIVAIVQSTALLGARALLVGIRPEVAQTIVGLGFDLGDIVTRATLEAGVSYTTQAANGTHPKGQRR